MKLILQLFTAALFCTMAFTTAFAQPADPLPSWNCGQDEAIDRDLRVKGHGERRARFRATARADRRLRQ